GANTDSEAAELPAIGRVIGTMADYAVITCGRTGEHGSHRACLEIRMGFSDLTKLQLILDRQEAIQWALNECQEGDAVVIVGMGTEPHTPRGSEGALANDSEIVREALRSEPITIPFRLAA
ncbi:MAG TPA: hypothetical protein VHU84_13810, partial [Lacipirellulaceae bacterium]|nr:hypothetical protein [Lacipirellulaceae bacterium]